MRSLTLKERLDNLFNDPNVEEVGSLLDSSLSGHRFDSRDDLKNHLNEGALLNISKVGSKALSVPCGEYLVWVTDPGHTTLVPTREPDREVFEGRDESYDILTPDLLQNWNKLSPIIAEEEYGKPEWQEEGEEYENRPEAPARGHEESGEFSSEVDATTVDRLPILRALQERGMTLTDLANDVGVDVPAISRILRKPRDVQGDPGGRNPSMELASKITAALRLDPKTAFPDFFKVDYGHEARKSPSNRGSGMKGHAKGSTKKGKATKQWTRGAA